MSSLAENHGPANDRWMQRIQTLIIGRLFAIFLLLVTCWVWFSGSLRISLDTFPEGYLFGLLLVFICLLYTSPSPRD